MPDRIRQNQAGFIAPLVIGIVVIFLAVILFYLYTSDSSSNLQPSVPDENTSVMPKQDPGVFYTTE